MKSKEKFRMNKILQQKHQSFCNNIKENELRVIESIFCESK
jgi:hypothetical protein